MRGSQPLSSQGKRLQHRIHSPPDMAICDSERLDGSSSWAEIGKATKLLSYILENSGNRKSIGRDTETAAFCWHNIHFYAFFPASPDSALHKTF